MKIFMLAVNGTIVSVPYRGATFLNIKTFQTSADSRRKFPSPIGELHFSILYLENFHIYITQFPSPIGELHFSIVNAVCSILSGRFPSPIGELHFSIKRYKMGKKGIKQVSVPYRGATFLNDRSYIFSVKSPRSFRPLSGSYISQLSPKN